MAAAAAGDLASEAPETEKAAFETAARNGSVGRKLVPTPSTRGLKGICAS